MNRLIVLTENLEERRVVAQRVIEIMGVSGVFLFSHRSTEVDMWGKICTSDCIDVCDLWISVN